MNNTTRIVAAASICIITSCAPTDPIDKVVTSAREDPRFGSGMYSPIKASETAPPLDVAAIALGKPTNDIVVLEVKQVQIAVDNQEKIAPGTTSYCALLVRTRYEEKKVVLVQYNNKLREWWTRIYDLDQ